MARQPSKKSSRTTAPKRKTTTTKRRKNDTSNSKSIVLLVAILALLGVLIIVAANSLKSDKELIKNAKNKPNETPKKEVVAKNEAKAENTLPPPAKPIKENKKEETSKDEDITAVIRLILYDYEISRTSVRERKGKDDNGRVGYFYNIKTNADTAKRAKDTLSSVLKKKGYKVKTDNEKITAGTKKDYIEIAFSYPKQKDVAKKTSNKKSEEVKEKKDIVGLPTPPEPANRVVYMSILLDDGGNSYELAERFAKSKYPMAIAILPHLEHSKEAARVCSAYKKNIFLHYPMQPKNYPDIDSGDGSALVTMPEILIEAVTKRNFESFKGVHIDGFNNHMGSAITEDAVKMSQIFKYAKQYTDTFVDSRTTPKSVAYDECVKAGLRCGINKKFIDNDNDVNTIIKMIYEAAEVAKKDGEILVIGHIRQRTLEALDIALPILESRKIAIVPIKTLVR